jgi:chromosome segregation ATPase
MKMREQLENRLEELRAELEAGQKMLNDLDTKRENLRQTLLRISGAIQVLEEELAKSADQQPGEPSSSS